MPCFIPDSVPLPSPLRAATVVFALVPVPKRKLAVFATFPVFDNTPVPFIAVPIPLPNAKYPAVLPRSSIPPAMALSSVKALAFAKSLS